MRNGAVCTYMELDLAELIVSYYQDSTQNNINISYILKRAYYSCANDPLIRHISWAKIVRASD